MRIFVTGATGFVGAHTTLELLDAGHDVRLLVRDEGLARRYFAGKGFEVDDFVTMRIATQYPVADSSKALAHARLEFRPALETFADAIRWQVEAGHLNPAKAGKLMDPKSSR